MLRERLMTSLIAPGHHRKMVNLNFEWHRNEDNRMDKFIYCEFEDSTSMTIAQYPADLTAKQEAEEHNKIIEKYNIVQTYSGLFL